MDDYPVSGTRQARFEANADLYAARRKFYQVKGMNLSLISTTLGIDIQELEVHT